MPLGREVDGERCRFWERIPVLGISVSKIAKINVTWNNSEENFFDNDIQSSRDLDNANDQGRPKKIKGGALRSRMGKYHIMDGLSLSFRNPLVSRTVEIFE